MTASPSYTAVPADVLAQLFDSARTHNGFLDRAVSDETLAQVYNLARMGPTACNCQPARFVFLRSAEAKERLRPTLMAGNVDKTMKAPIVVIAAIDTQFYDFLPEQFPVMPVRDMFASNAAVASDTATRNANLQAGYFIMAARACGLSCGPMSGFDQAKVDSEFFPEGRWKSNFLINLGYGEPTAVHPRGPRLDFGVATKTL